MMENRLAAIEVSGTIDENRRLLLDEELPVRGPKRVKVIVLYQLADEISEEEWLQAAANNPAFRYLQDAEEDIYTLEDGKPLT